MNEAAVVERPAWRVSFRFLVAVVAGLVLISVVAGRYVYERYGGYRPLALAHVPSDMRYRARVDLNDQPRSDVIRPLLVALDPRGKRRQTLEKAAAGSGPSALREVAFGVGPDPYDFVVVLGLQLQAETGLPAAKTLCDALGSDGLHPEANEAGCHLAEGALVAGTPDGTVVIASRPELVKGLLGVPDIGDRLGFSGPSVRGAAPELPELAREAATLAQRISAKYP